MIWKDIDSFLANTANDLNIMSLQQAEKRLETNMRGLVKDGKLDSYHMDFTRSGKVIRIFMEITENNYRSSTYIDIHERI